MATRGSTNLNRILKVTAHLLFEKGQNVGEVHNLMQGFVDRPMLQKWHESYCSSLAIPFDSNRPEYKSRIPLPPIDWDGVQIEDLEEKTESAQASF